MHTYLLPEPSSYPSEKTNSEIVDFILSLNRPGGHTLSDVHISNIMASRHIKYGSVYEGEIIYNLHPLIYNSPLVHWDLVSVNRHEINTRKKFCCSSLAERGAFQAAVDSPMPPVVIISGSIFDGCHRLSRVKSESIEQGEDMPFLAYVAKFPYDA